MQETQHTQQKATRTSQYQDNVETACMLIDTKTQKTHRNKKLIIKGNYNLAHHNLVSNACLFKL